MNVNPKMFWLILLPGGFLIWAYYHFTHMTDAEKQSFADSHPNIAALLISTGVFGGKQPDVTGSTGQAIETASFNAVASNTSQGYYNACLMEYSYESGLSTTLAGQGTPGWPWASYDDWKTKNYPPLPYASTVSVDSHGMWHNDYI